MTLKGTGKANIVNPPSIKIATTTVIVAMKKLAISVIPITKVPMIANSDIYSVLSVLISPFAKHLYAQRPAPVSKAAPTKTAPTFKK